MHVTLVKMMPPMEITLLRTYLNKAKTENCDAIIISGSIESEIAILEETEKKEFLKI